MAPCRFAYTSLMCAGSLYMISGWLISQSLRPIYLNRFPSILSWFVFGQLPSANVPPVRLACLCDRIASDGSRSVAMGYCPAGSSLLAADRSIARDMLSAISPGHVSNPLICPISWHQLVSRMLLSTGFRPVTLDGSSARPY